MEQLDSGSPSNGSQPFTKSTTTNNIQFFTEAEMSIEPDTTTEVSTPFEAHSAAETQDTTPEEQGKTEDENTAEGQSAESTQANEGPFEGELFYEPPKITAAIVALLANPPSGHNRQLVYRFLALASNHLQINSMTTENGIQNTCTMYSYLLESAKELKAKNAECTEILYALGVLKHNISIGKGISAQLVRQWAQQIVNAIKASEQSP